MAADRRKEIQETEYGFPYHYIPTYEHGAFSLARTMRWGCEYISYINFVLEQLEEIPFESLLDVGCGDGRLLFELSRRRPGKKLVGLDISLRAIRFAQAFNCSEDVEFVCGNIRDASLFGSEFDAATLIETLEHVPPEALAGFIEGVHSHLKENASLVLTVPSKNFRLPPKHYQHFDLETLERLLGPYFSISGCHYINRFSAMRTAVDSLLANRFFILNERRIVNMLYRFYEKRLFHASPGNAQRILLVCMKKSAGGRSAV